MFPTSKIDSSITFFLSFHSNVDSIDEYLVTNKNSLCVYNWENTTANAFDSR